MPLPASLHLRAEAAMAHDEAAHGERGERGGVSGAQGAGWVVGGFESSAAPWMASRHAVMRTPSPSGDEDRNTVETRIARDRSANRARAHGKLASRKLARSARSQ